MKKILIILIAILSFNNIEAQINNRPTPHRGGVLIPSNGGEPLRYGFGWLIYDSIDSILKISDGTKWDIVGSGVSDGNSFATNGTVTGSTLTITGNTGFTSFDVDVSSLVNVDISDMASTQIINLGDIGLNSVESAFNSYTFTGSENPLQDQADGYVLVNVVENGLVKQYLFIGQGGAYGITGNLTALPEDFTLLESEDLNNLDVWHAADNLGLDTGNPALTYTQPIIHGANVLADRFRPSGGVDGGILNTGSNSLYIRGNQGVVLQGVNPNNNNNVSVTSNGIITSLLNGETVRSLNVSRSFTDVLPNDNIQYIGVDVSDEVNIESKTNSRYVGLNINPTITGNIGSNRYFAINSEIGDVNFQNGFLTLGGFTLPNTDGTSGQTLVTDGNGAVNWQTISGGSTPETTATIQSKRPIKTVNGITLEGTGDIPFPSDQFGEVQFAAGITYIGTSTEVDNFTKYTITGDGNSTFLLPEYLTNTEKIITFTQEGVGKLTVTPSTNNINQKQYVQDFNGLDTDALSIYIREDNTYHFHRGDDNAVVGNVIPPSPPEEYLSPNALNPTNEMDGLTDIQDELSNLVTFQSIANTDGLDGGSFMVNTVAGGAVGRTVQVFNSGEFTEMRNYVIEATAWVTTGSGFFNNWDGFFFYTDDTFTTLAPSDFIQLTNTPTKYVRYARARDGFSLFRIRMYTDPSSEVNISRISFRESTTQD